MVSGVQIIKSTTEPKLPKINALEVLARMRADERTKHLPVTVLTSSREEHDIVESYRLNVNSYIAKPVDFEQFTTAVRQIGFYWLLLNQPRRYRAPALWKWHYG